MTPDRPLESYIGEWVGHFLVLDMAPPEAPNAGRRWWVRCRCGRELPQRPSLVRKGHRQHCGCGGTTVMLHQWFDHLYVVAPAARQDGRGISWLCRCRCGRYHTVKGTDLRGRRVKSCGCRNPALPATRRRPLPCLVCEVWHQLSRLHFRCPLCDPAPLSQPLPHSLVLNAILFPPPPALSDR
jgi:hypothetical protein